MDLIEVAERIKSLREILEFSCEDAAKACGVSVEEYNAVERGEKDFSATFLMKLSDFFGVDATDILTGVSPKLSSFTVSKKGEGLSITRRKGFEYLNLAYKFKNRLGEPFRVTAPYVAEEENEPLALSVHEGEEFDFVLSGKMLVSINGKEFFLEEGDSVYYNSLSPHGMRAVDGKSCEFLAILFKNNR